MGLFRKLEIEGYMGLHLAALPNRLRKFWGCWKAMFFG